MPYQVQIDYHPAFELYAWPASQTDFSEWDPQVFPANNRVTLAEDLDGAGMYSGSLDEAVATLWYIFIGSNQPSSFSEHYAKVDLSTIVAAAAAKTAAVSAQNLAEADEMIIDDAGTLKRHLYAKGTTTDLVPPKTCKQLGGTAATSTSQRLAGFQE